MFVTLMKSLSQTQKSLFLLCLEMLWISGAFFLAQFLSGAGALSFETVSDSSWYLAVLLPAGALLTVAFGLHMVKLNAYSLNDAIDTAMLAVALGLWGVSWGLAPLDKAIVAPKVFVIMSLLYLVLSVSGRIAIWRLVHSIFRKNQIRKRVMIYGAGQTGQQLAAALKTDDEIEGVCFVDDNLALQKLTIDGMKVFSSLKVRTLVKKFKIDRIILAMPSAKQIDRFRIIKELQKIGCEIHTLPSFADMVLRGEELSTAAPAENSTLLGRTALAGDLPSSAEHYEGRSILVTGAGGSIGSELCRQILQLKPKKLVLLDHSELALYSIMREFAGTFQDTELKAVLGSITESSLVTEALIANEVEVVFHAAAYKHLPLVQSNPLEGLRNNILGTMVVAEAAQRADVNRFILVSSDKAVRPTSIMGASKRMAELVVQDLATRSKHTRFSMVRFGNVLGSSGSVIPLFEDQIKRGGPVTVTHPEVSRYFMTASEAVRLVLLAGTFSRGGDVFVLDMGQPVRILEIAQKMIANAGYQIQDLENPDGDIAIQFTGLRPGEKMHEELLIGSDMLTTPHLKILRAQEICLSEIEVASALQDLRRAIENRDVETAMVMLRKWVENYELSDENENIVA